MAIKTVEAKLTMVQTAIENIVTNGQDITYNGKRLTQANLPSLISYENELLKQYNAEQGRGLTVNSGITRR